MHIDSTSLSLTPLGVSLFLSVYISLYNTVFEAILRRPGQPHREGFTSAAHQVTQQSLSHWVCV